MPLQLDDPSFHADHCRLRSVVGPQFRKDAFDSALDCFLRDRELMRNLLVRIPGRYQSQHKDFCWGQGVISRMLGDFVGNLWRELLLARLD